MGFQVVPVGYLVYITKLQPSDNWRLAAPGPARMPAALGVSMFRAAGSRAMVVGAALLLAAGPGLAQAPAEPPPAAASTTVGAVDGSAWKGDAQPYPHARIRLRSVDTGRGVARTVSDGDGQFRFERVDPGAYVVELLSSGDKVLAVGDLFGVAAGGQATTLVRLSSKAPWVAGFFGNAAAAAITAASTLGVTAVGSNGSPASGQ
jgi:hypothetical protein